MYLIRFIYLVMVQIKLKNDKYELTLISGDKVITYDEVIIKNNLLYKKDITSKEIDAMADSLNQIM